MGSDCDPVTSRIMGLFSSLHSRAGSRTLSPTPFQIPVFSGSAVKALSRPLTGHHGYQCTSSMSSVCWPLLQLTWLPEILQIYIVQGSGLQPGLSKFPLTQTRFLLSYQGLSIIEAYSPDSSVPSTFLSLHRHQ